MLLMVALTVIVVVAVIYRKLDASLSWYDEVASVGLAWITYYGGALAVLKRKHIGFDSVLLSIPMPIRLYLAIFAEIVFIAFFALLAVGFRYKSPSLLSPLVRVYSSCASYWQPLPISEW